MDRSREVFGDLVVPVVFFFVTRKRKIGILWKLAVVFTSDLQPVFTSYCNCKVALKHAYIRRTIIAKRPTLKKKIISWISPYSCALFLPLHHMLPTVTVPLEAMPCVE